MSVSREGKLYVAGSVVLGDQKKRTKRGWRALMEKWKRNCQKIVEEIAEVYHYPNLDTFPPQMPGDVVTISRVRILQRLYFFTSTSIYWKTAELNSMDSGIEISSNEDEDDKLQILFKFVRRNSHSIGPDQSMCVYAPHNKVLESFSHVPIEPTIITIHASELLSDDTTTIMQSESVRLLADFINTHAVQKNDPQLLKYIIKNINFIPLAPQKNLMLVVEQSPTIQSVYYTVDVVKEKAIRDRFEQTKRGTCCVCLGEYKAGLDATRFHCCLKVVHRACILQWLALRPTCPICGIPLPPKVAKWL